MNLIGPELTEGLYCTLTNVKVYGRTMHAVMQDSLMDLVKPAQEKPTLMLSASTSEETHSKDFPKRTKPASSSKPSSFTSESLDAKFSLEFPEQDTNPHVTPAIDHIFTGRLVDNGICASISA